MNLSEVGFKYGLEYEFCLLRAHDQFVDFTNTTFDELQCHIDVLPRFASDYPGLRVGDLGIKSKRWYLEGFERFSDTGDYLYTDIKGPEIRTPICESIDEAVQKLEADYQTYLSVIAKDNFSPVAVGWNPFAVKYEPAPPLNDWETLHRITPEEQTAYIHMTTYGPDVSLSHVKMSVAQTIDAARKLTYYSHVLTAFAYNSPFAGGALWGGLSRRTSVRTGLRPAAVVFVPSDNDVISTIPTLIEMGRIPAEVGRIEFKGFDACPDREWFGALLFLIKGVLMSNLPGRADTPNPQLHQWSAKVGLRDDKLLEEATVLLEAATNALPLTDRPRLSRFHTQLVTRRCPADDLIDYFRQHSDIIGALRMQHDHYLRHSYIGERPNWS